MTKAIANKDRELCDELAKESTQEQCDDLYESAHPKVKRSFFEEEELPLTEDLIVSDPLAQE